MAKKKTLYEVLDVPKDAKPEAIKKAHRKKVRQHHPDTGGDAASFALVQRAYETLYDDAKRSQYDATGDEGDGNPQKFKNILADHLLAAIHKACQSGGSVKNRDIIDAMRQGIRGQIANAKDGIKQNTKPLAEFKEALKRIKEKEPFFRPIIENEIAKIERIQAGIPKQIADHQEALAYLKNCSFDFDPMVGGFQFVQTTGNTILFTTGT